MKISNETDNSNSSKIQHVGIQQRGSLRFPYGKLKVQNSGRRYSCDPVPSPSQVNTLYRDRNQSSSSYENENRRSFSIQNKSQRNLNNESKVDRTFDAITSLRDLLQNLKQSSTINQVVPSNTLLLLAPIKQFAVRPLKGDNRLDRSHDISSIFIQLVKKYQQKVGMIFDRDCLQFAKFNWH